MQNFHIKHTGGFSDIDGNLYDVKIWESNSLSTGINSELLLSDEAIKIQQVPKDNLLGSKCTLKIKAFQEEEYYHLYNNKEGDYILEIIGDNGFIWIGVIVPGQYSEDFANPPFDIQINAVDGLGRLNEMYTEAEEISIMGSNLWEQFLNVLKQCSPIPELQIHNVILPYEENGINIFKTYATDFLFFDKNSKKKTLYKFLQEFCKVFDFYITQRNGVWLLYNEQLAVEETEYKTFERYDLLSQMHLGSIEVPIIYSADRFVFDGAVKYIIPPLSTLDITWTRETYNTGTNSNLVNPLFKNDYETWSWVLDLPSGPGIVNYSEDQPVYNPNYEGKSAIVPGQLYFIQSFLFFAVARFNLTSMKVPVREGNVFSLSVDFFVKKMQDSIEMRLFENMGLQVIFTNNANQVFYLTKTEIENEDGDNDFVYSFETDQANVSQIVNYSFDSWVNAKIVDSFLIPEDGYLQVKVGDVILRIFDEFYSVTDIPAILNMGIHAINLFAVEEDGESSTFTESIRIQSDEYGFTENKTIDLYFANKNEILADGNLYQINELDFIPGFQYKMSEKIQYLLAAKIWNQNKYPRESIQAKIKGIVPTCSVISNIPARPGKLYQLDEIKEYDLRENKTDSIITLRNTQCEPVKMEIYNDDILVETKTIFCSNDFPKDEPPVISKHQILKLFKDGREIIGMHVVLRRYTQDTLAIDLYSNGETQELDVRYPNGNTITYQFPYFNRLYFAPYPSNSTYQHIELFDNGTYQFKLRSINQFGITEITRGIGITLI